MTRVATTLPWLFLGVAFVACLAASLLLARDRLVAAGEAEILHEAFRIRHGLALYVDASVGQNDYGGTPSRVWVLYPPFTSWLVSWLPEAHATLIGRVLCVLTFVVALAVPVIAAPRSCRRTALLAALYVGSIFVLWLFTSVIRPDAIAILLIAIFLERVARLGRTDAIVGVLAGMAVLVKPNMCGAATGVLVGGLLWSRGRDAIPARRAIIAAAMTFSAGLATLAIWSHGTFAEHFVRSFGQPWTLANLVTRVLPRITTLLAPLVLAFVVLVRRRVLPSARIMLTALVVSIGVTTALLSRMASSANYWLEPLFVALVVVSKQALWPLEGAKPTTIRAAAILLSIQTAIPAYLAVEGAFDLRESAAGDQLLLRLARERCGGVVRSDHPGVEYELNGRVIATSFTLNHAVSTGHFPPDRYVDELLDPRTACIVTTDVGAGSFPAFIEASRARLRAEFALDQVLRDSRLYVRTRR